MDVGVDIIDALAIRGNGIAKGRLALCVTRALAVTVAFALMTVTVNVHVYELATRSLHVDNALVLKMIPTVAEICCTALDTSIEIGSNRETSKSYLANLPLG